MAGRRSRPSVGVPREQFQQEQEQKKREEAVTVPANYASDYGSKLDLHPARYPNAISHDPVFHDNVFEHIANLRARLDAGLQSPEIKRITPEVTGHLNAAENQLKRSFAAHKAGFDSGVDAIHTAVEAYKQAHLHLTNAHRAIVNGLGVSGRAANTLIGNNAALPLLTSERRANLVKDYTNHVKSVAVNSNAALPAGVAEHKDLDLSDVGEITPVTSGRYTQANRSSRETRAPEQIKQAKALNRVRTGLEKIQKSPSSGTVTLEAVQRAQQSAVEGKPQRVSSKPSVSPYSGVGVTGFNTVVNSAKVHFEANNPGKKWSESAESKDPVAYAVKNRVGFPSLTQTLGRTVRTLGLDKRGPGEGAKGVINNIPAIAQNKYTEAPIPKDTAAKPSRSGEFKSAGDNK